MNRTLWIGSLFVFILATVVWIVDSRLYDKDLESDHIRETGLSWKDIESERTK